MKSSFNLNTSRKPEHNLNENLIHENIQMYGIQAKYLFSERINQDKLVFGDFSHFKVKKDYKDIMILPEDGTNWEGENMFNTFGFYNQQSQNVFISKSTLLELYPKFETTSPEIVNSLLLLPSGSIVEITHLEEFNEGVNNLWAYADTASSYKLTLKVYSVNLADEGVSDIETTISLDEGPENSNGEEKIFEHEEVVTTDIDKFFDELSITKTLQDTEGDAISNTGGPFGSLS